MPTCRLATACSGFIAKCSALEAVAAGAFLAALASDLRTAACTASTKAFVILDGTLLPIDRITADRPFYSGKHEKHGMNVQTPIASGRSRSAGSRRQPRRRCLFFGVLFPALVAVAEGTCEDLFRQDPYQYRAMFRFTPLFRFCAAILARSCSGRDQRAEGKLWNFR